MKWRVLRLMEGNRYTYLCIIAFIFRFYQQYSPKACITEALGPPDSEELAVFDAYFASRECTSITHIVPRLFTATAYVPT